MIIVGGGLAGMACAVALDSAGINVTLLESRKTLGGRAGSFEDPQTGEQLDNCQHVLLGCCTNLIDFYRRIGADSLIRFHRDIHFRDERGRRYDLFGIGGLPAPLHLGPSLIRFSALTLAERWKLTEAMLDMAQTNRDDVADLSFGEWLDAHGQPESLVRKFYDTVVISGLNEETRAASAKYAIQIFQESLLANAAGYVVGMPVCSLGELYARLATSPSPGTPGESGGEGLGEWLAGQTNVNGANPHPNPSTSRSPRISDYRERGPEGARLTVRLATRVAEIRCDHNRIAGVELQNGETLTADAYVLATNHHAVQKWIPAELASRDRRFANLDRFDSVPILGVHLWFDRPILRESHAAAAAGRCNGCFERTSTEKRCTASLVLHAIGWIGPKTTCSHCLNARYERHLRTRATRSWKGA